MSKTNIEALKHLKKDAVLKLIITRVGELDQKKRSDLYLALLQSVVSQQLSSKAADTIWKRFVLLFEDAYPSAQRVLQMDTERMRGAGLSYQKAGYVKNIAGFSLQNTLDYAQLKKKSDEELIEYLVQIKGVGRWTVEMILMFGLNRPDVFPLDDLGIQNGMKDLYKIKAADKKALARKMLLVAERWKPYRTLACRYIWRYKDSPVKK